MPALPYSTIIFDLDGTLSDPREGVFKGFRYALRKMGREFDGQADLSMHIGPPLPEVFRSYFFETEEEVLRAIAFFREYYAATGLFENSLYEGIGDLVKILRAGGARLAVATYKPQRFAEQILRHFEIADAFGLICGADEIAPEPKAELLQKILRQANGPAVLVGDTRYDIIAAKAAGIDCIAVSYGFGKADELRDANYVVHSVEELKSLLSAQAAGAS